MSNDSGGSAGDCVFGPTCMSMAGDSGPTNSTQIDATSPGNGGLSDFIDPLCGTAGVCNPDNRLSCADYSDIAARVSSERAADTDATVVPPDAASEIVDATAEEAGLRDGGGLRDASLDATVDAATGDATLPDAAVDGGGTPAPPKVSFGCRVMLDDDQIKRGCGPAGKGTTGAACTASSDCDAGLGCVGEPGAGRCLPYCCTGGDTCAAGTFCAPRPLREASSSSSSPPNVPVCVPADQCHLDEAFPCTNGAAQGCVCKPSTACTVVRDDGTTSCVEPGEGKVGDPCPCAHDHFCSQATGTCLRICNVHDTTSNPCGTGKCQTALVFPEGWGVCVGGPTPTK